MFPRASPTLARCVCPAAVILPLFGATLFLSAFLMFLVEPMVAKMLLPVLGGTPMVWNTCVVFFQMMLLAGYGYAYALSRWLDAVHHRPLHVVVVAIPLTMLPFATRAAWTPPTGSPLAWLLAALVMAIGLPFFALATTASVLQHWFGRTDHAAAGDPYFLYIASNVGSLLALAAYPALVEPAFPLDVQSRWWAIGYSVFAVLTCGCAIAMRWSGAGNSSYPSARTIASTALRETSIPMARRLRWIALSFVPASLMLGVTTYLSTDIAAVPLMWIVPLAIYLITFVLAFSAVGRRTGGDGRKTGADSGRHAGRLHRDSDPRAADARHPAASRRVCLARAPMPRRAGERPSVGVAPDRVLLPDLAWRDAGRAVQHAARARHFSKRDRISAALVWRARSAPSPRGCQFVARSSTPWCPLPASPG